MHRLDMLRIQPEEEPRRRTARKVEAGQIGARFEDYDRLPRSEQPAEVWDRFTRLSRERIRDRDRQQEWDRRAAEQRQAATTCLICHGSARPVAPLLLAGELHDRVCHPCSAVAQQEYPDAMSDTARRAAVRDWLTVVLHSDEVGRLTCGAD